MSEIIGIDTEIPNTRFSIPWVSCLIGLLPVQSLMGSVFIPQRKCHNENGKLQ